MIAGTNTEMVQKQTNEKTNHSQSDKVSAPNVNNWGI